MLCVPISLAHPSVLAMLNSMAQESNMGGGEEGEDTQVTLQSLRNDGSEGSLVLHTEALVLVPGSLGQLSPPGGDRRIILIVSRMRPKIFNMAEEEKLSFSHPVY